VGPLGIRKAAPYRGWYDAAVVAARIAISVTLSGLSQLFGGDLARVVEAARIADDAGVDQIAIPDHVAMGRHTERYPYGRFPLPLEEPWLEPLTALAAIAGATRRIRLATGVLIAPLRPAVLLAKTVATLDVLSRGRVDLGVGVGWQPEEYAAAGVPFAERWSRLDDALGACRALWREAPARFASKSVRFDELWSLPRPVQPGGPPIWLGVAPTPRNARRLAELGDGWLPMTSDVGELRSAVATLRAAFRAAGRDPAALRVRANAPGGELPKALAALPELADAGATMAGFALARFARTPDEVRPFLERLGREGART
jgi:probable F420-dependent oxidoreductase